MPVVVTAHPWAHFLQIGALHSSSLIITHRRILRPLANAFAGMKCRFIVAQSLRIGIAMSAAGGYGNHSVSVLDPDRYTLKESPFAVIITSGLTL